MTEENKENRNLPLSSLNYLNAELSKLKLCRNLGKLSIPIFQNLFSLLGPQVRDIPSRIVRSYFLYIPIENSLYKFTGTFKTTSYS